MHSYTADDDRIARTVAEYCLQRLSQDGSARPPADAAGAGEAGRRHASTPEGIGRDEALRLWADVLGPACLSVDHPRYLSFIPNAPTKAACYFDMLVAASNVYSGSWLEGSGAVYAENQALRWIADLAGLPPQAGGTFVQGGTIGNLSALVAAREAALRAPRPPARALGRVRHRRDALVGQARAAGRHGRRRDRRCPATSAAG